MSKTSKEQRENWWNHLISEKGMRPRGVTLKRLEKIKDEVVADDYFWFNVIDRFGGELSYHGSRFYDSYPKANTDASRGNFWSMVRERIVK